MEQEQVESGKPLDAPQVQQEAPVEPSPVPEPAPVSPPPPTDNMEVHHHAHHDHGKKTWRNYFWEFFMLFLAVFCGSLAELQVEHYIEHQREKKYIQTLIEDLSNDTADLNYDISYWNNVLAQADLAIAELEKPVGKRDHKALYKAAASLTGNNTFLYHDRTIQQLKSSGNFRLIRNNAIADSITEYDARINTAIKNVEDAYFQTVGPDIVSVENQLFNAKYFGDVKRGAGLLDSVFAANPEILMMKSGKEDLAFQFYNKIFNHRGITQTRITFLSGASRRAGNLISLLKKEYGE